MTLKVQLNGVKKNLFSPSHPPVTFIGGVRKKLLRGWTFVNGQKKQLWGFGMDIININPDQPNEHALMYIDDKVAIFNTSYLSGTSDTAYSPYIHMYDITNPSNPTYVAGYQWGRVTCSTPDATSGTVAYSAVYSYVYYRKQEGSYHGTPIVTEYSKAIYNRIIVNTVDGSLSVTDTYDSTTHVQSITANRAIKTTGSWIGASVIPGRTIFHTYYPPQITLYNNSSAVVTEGIDYDSAQTDGLARFAQATIDSNSILFVPTNNNAIKRGTTSAATDYITNLGFYVCSMFGDTDNKLVLAGSGGWALYNGTTLIANGVDGDTNYRYYVLGRINDHYYIVGGPRNSSALNQNSVVLIIDKDTGVIDKTETPPTVANAPYVYGSSVMVTPYNGTDRGYLGCYLGTGNGVLRIQGS